MIKLFSGWYFFYIGIAIVATIILYFLFRKKSQRCKFWIVEGLLIFNLLLHFTKPLYPPYSTGSTEYVVRHLLMMNVCAVSVFAFPFIFFSKNKTLKDFMFYLGVISGFLSLVYPTEAIDKMPFALNTIRFYICHSIVIIAPLLMMLYKLHKLNYKRIWKMPLLCLGVLSIIVLNEVIATGLGVTSAPINNSYQWGPGSDSVTIVLTFFTPQFLKTIPLGVNAGQPGYWPILWMAPALIVYFTILPFLLSLPWEFKHFTKDVYKLFSKKERIRAKQATIQNTTEIEQNKTEQNIIEVQHEQKPTKVERNNKSENK